MHPVLIGSRALNFWNPSLKISPDTDWDVISYEDHEGCEVHDPMFLNNQEMTEYASSETVCLPDGSVANVMSMIGLAIIKRSHLWRNLSFQKHITMYHKYGLADCLSKCRNFTPVQQDLSQRIKLTKEAFPQRQPNLMQRNEDFFNDAVTKVYEHDLLHELLAYEDKPLYTKLQRDSSITWCHADLWYDLSDLQKLQCVAEEVQVIAAERFLIPSGFKSSSKLAYVKALDKVCTTLCSGWFRDFAIDHYPKILGLYKKHRFIVLQSKLQTLPRKELKCKNKTKPILNL